MLIAIYPDDLLIRVTNFQYKNQLIIAGWVVNGYWFYKQVDNAVEAYSEDQKTLVTSYVLKNNNRKVVLVEDTKSCHRYYNEILDKYKEHEETPMKTLRHEFLCYSYVEESKEKEYDDDIPF